MCTRESLDQPEIKKKKRKHKEEEEEQSSKKSIYSRFEKSSVLMGNKEESLQVEKESVVIENNTSVPMPSDDELHRICGGRTAHKGARHGIKMNGKLQRLQEQEERVLSSPFDNISVEKKKKKRKTSETNY